MSLDAETTAIYSRIWGLPLRSRHGCLTVALGAKVPQRRGIRLCAWEIPEDACSSATRILEAWGCRPAVFHSAAGRTTIVATFDTPPARHRLDRLAAVVYRDSGDLELPEPGDPQWISYPLPGDRFPAAAEIEGALRCGRAVSTR